jgi:hypothetical protein
MPICDCVLVFPADCELAPQAKLILAANDNAATGESKMTG